MDASSSEPKRKNPARALVHALQGVATIALLGWASARVDWGLFSADKLQPGWLLLALVCTAPAYAGASLRWAFTAQRLGVALPFRRALTEIYLASLLNCTLPSGMAGDLLRIARHGSAGREGRARYSRALLSVLIERTSGQVLLWAVLVISVLSLRASLLTLSALLVLAFGLTLFASLRVRGALRLDDEAAARAGREATIVAALRSAVLTDGALAVQLVSSALVLAACTLGFACCARGLSVPLSWLELVRIVPPLLALSALPLSIGGFGVREVASAALYAQSGLDPATGVAVAASYGLMNLLGSVPGVFCLRRGAEQYA